MKIDSKYFTYEELIETSKPFDNTPSEVELKNLQTLVTNVLDPLRKEYGKPITVNSGYRSKKVNDALGSKDTSDHRRGMAADLDAGPRSENEKLYNLIKSMFKFKQLIDESGFSWVHVSYDPKNLKCQVLKM